jgi:hypothetical protein
MCACSKSSRNPPKANRGIRVKKMVWVAVALGAAPVGSAAPLTHEEEAKAQKVGEAFAETLMARVRVILAEIQWFDGGIDASELEQLTEDYRNAKINRNKALRNSDIDLEQRIRAAKNEAERADIAEEYHNLKLLKTLPDRVVQQFARDGSVVLRRYAAWSEELDDESQLLLAKDTDKLVRFNLAQQSRHSQEVETLLATDSEWLVRATLALRKTLRQDTKAKLMNDEDVIVSCLARKKHDPAAKDPVMAHWLDWQIEKESYFRSKLSKLSKQ